MNYRNRLQYGLQRRDIGENMRNTKTGGFLLCVQVNLSFVDGFLFKKILSDLRKTVSKHFSSKLYGPKGQKLVSTAVVDLVSFHSTQYKLFKELQV